MLFGQGGKVFDLLTMDSKILEMERRFAVYLPPCYETSQRSYPALYLLHGGGDDQTGWIQFGEVHHIADKAIREGKATPMVIVMPDAPQEKIDAWFNKYSVLDAIRNMPEEQKRAVRWYIDCGDDNFLFEGNEQLSDFRLLTFDC